MKIDIRKLLLVILIFFYGATISSLISSFANPYVIILVSLVIMLGCAIAIEKIDEKKK